MSANRGGDMARTTILPTLAHSSSHCWWYFLANFMNSCLPTLSLNLSRFWLMRGLILTWGVFQVLCRFSGVFAFFIPLPVHQVLEGMCYTTRTHSSQLERFVKLWWLAPSVFLDRQLGVVLEQRSWHQEVVCRSGRGSTC